jgi:hypothetical protein
VTYVCWAALYEGNTDRAYFNVLIPRIIENLLITEGIRNSSVTTAPTVELGAKGRSVELVAAEACAARDAFHFVIIHADTGGRSQAEGLAERSMSYCEAMHVCCEWSQDRCIVMTPSHEMEAWVLADPLAITDAYGFKGNPESLGLPSTPRQAEKLVDPKATLAEVIRTIRGRRSPDRMDQLLPAIAQRQSIDALRKSVSFSNFESRLRRGLADLGCLPPGGN